MKKRILAFVLFLCMMISISPLVFAADSNVSYDLTFDEVDPGIISGDIVAASGAKANSSQNLSYNSSDQVKILVAMSKPGALKAGYSASNITDNTEAMDYMDKLKEMHEEVTANIAKNSEVDVSFADSESYSLIADAFEATVKYSDISNLNSFMEENYGSDYDGIYVVPSYEIQSYSDVAVPYTLSATEMVGATNAWENGFKGSGTLIAVIDTGLDIDHPSFDGNAFEYSIKQDEAENSKKYDLLTKEEVAEKLNAGGLHAAESANQAAGSNESVNPSSFYKNLKVPFAYNYFDKSFDVTHDNDSAGDHGTHVSGIASANRYVKTVDSTGAVKYDKQAEGVVGVAPNAQLVVMKVFGGSLGTTSTDVYMPAIEDAILLGCDAVNLSLGSSAPGYSYDTSNYEEIFDNMVDSGTLVVFSAGNSGYWPQHNLANDKGLNFAEDIHMQTDGSSGSYTNSFTVASDMNTTLTGFGGTFNGHYAVVTDGTNANNEPWKSLDKSEDASGTEYDYIFLGDPNDNDISSNSAKYGNLSVYTEEIKAEVKGKIVLVSRGGGVTFADKHKAAQEAGAAGCIIYNNVSDSLTMTLEGSTATIPCASIQLRDANIILEATEKNDKGFYAGKMSVRNVVETIENDESGYEMSDFSSWGTTGNLAIKPEITAPGGNIYSSITDGQYGVMSGTSMSAPSITGQGALVSQYINENGLLEKAKTVLPTKRALVTSLLMCTASPLVDPECDAPYSVRQQGAGLSNVDAATSTPAFIVMDESATESWKDGKVKAELGDDADRTGVYSFSFRLYNLTEQDVAYELGSSVITPEIISDDAGVKYMSTHSKFLSPQLKFTVNGQNAAGLVYDFNGDGAVDQKDAEILNEHVSGIKHLNEIQESKADFDQDGLITSIDVYLFLQKIDSNDVRLSAVGVTLPADGSIQVGATITLSAEDKAYFEENNPNGAYVEGYITLSSDVPLTIPFLTYYGNFTEPPMYDRTSYLTDQYGPEENKKQSYISGDNTVNYMTMRLKGSATQYYYGPNLYAEDKTFEYDRNMVLSPKSTSLYSTCPSFIRSPDLMRITISDTELKNIYWSATYNAVLGAFYNESNSEWSSTVSQVRLGDTSEGWSGTDANGAELPDGSKVLIRTTAVPELYASIEKDENGNAVKKIKEENLSSGAFQDYTVTIDSEEPEIKEIKYQASLSDSSDKLVVTAQDNRHIAAVQLYNETGRKRLSAQPAYQTQSGVETTVEVDITNIPGTRFLVAAIDFAGNMDLHEVDIENVSNREPGTVPDDPDDDSVYVLAADQNNKHIWATANMQDGNIQQKNILPESAQMDWQCAAYHDGYIYGFASQVDSAEDKENTSRGKQYLYWMDYGEHDVDPLSGVSWTTDSNKNIEITDITYSPTYKGMIMPAVIGMNDNFESGEGVLSILNPSNPSTLRYIALNSINIDSDGVLTGITYLYTADFKDSINTYIADYFLAIDTNGNCYLIRLYEKYGMLNFEGASAGKIEQKVEKKDIFNSTLIQTVKDRKIYYISGLNINELTFNNSDSKNPSVTSSSESISITNAIRASAMLQLKEDPLDPPSADDQSPASDISFSEPKILGSYDEIMSGINDAAGKEDKR